MQYILELVAYEDQSNDVNMFMRYLGKHYKLSLLWLVQDLVVYKIYKLQFSHGSSF